MTGLGFYTGSHCSSGRILTFFLHIFALRGGFDSGFIPHFQNAFEPVRTRSRTRSTRSSPFGKGVNFTSSIGTRSQSRLFYVFYPFGCFAFFAQLLRRFRLPLSGLLVVLVLKPALNPCQALQDTPKPAPPKKPAAVNICLLASHAQK